MAISPDIMIQAAIYGNGKRLWIWNGAHLVPIGATDGTMTPEWNGDIIRLRALNVEGEIDYISVRQ